MSYEIFIVIDLDSGTRCMTTAASQTRTLDGESYAFLSGLSDVKLPSYVVDPRGSAGSKGQISARFFEDNLDPGSVITKYSRIQGCQMRAWVVTSQGRVYPVFNGEVSAANHKVEGRYIDITGGPTQSNVEVPFPPATTLEDGRYVARKQENTQILELGNRYDVSFTWLQDQVYFYTAYGSPVDSFDGDPTDAAAPVGTIGTSWYQTDIPALSGDNRAFNLYDPEQKTFLWWDNSSRDEAVPVVYGTARNMSVSPLAHYRVRVGEKLASGSVSYSYYKIYIYPIACHRVIGDPRVNYWTSSGAYKVPDFLVGVRWADDQHQAQNYGQPTTAIANTMLGYIGTDARSLPVAYTTVAVPYDINFEEVQEATNPEFRNFDPAGVYLSFVQGKPKSTAEPFSGLGDTLLDIWSTYGGGSGADIDWALVSHSTDRLNGYAADLVFNRRAKNQTIDRVLNSRVSSSFPVVFNKPRGRMSWVCNSLPLQVPQSIRTFEYGVELVSRSAVTETSRGKVRNDVVMSYGIDGKRSGSAFTSTRNRGNSEICAASFSRWGLTPTQSLSAPDTQSGPTADLILDQYVLLNAGVRVGIQYETTDVSVVNIPPLSVVEITDTDAGFNGDRFWFLGYDWMKNQMTVQIRLLSVGML